MIQVGGYKPSTVIDFEIPKRYGLRQTIADTLGIGGIFRALRTIPVVLEMCRDMEEVCPDVCFLNYVNPMAMVTGAVLRATRIKTVGLCHSVQGTAEQLARYLDVPAERDGVSVRGDQSYGVLSLPARQWRGCLPDAARAVWRCRIAYPPLPGPEADAPGQRASCGCTTPCASRCSGGSATSSPSRASTSRSTCPTSSNATIPN